MQRENRSELTIACAKFRRSQAPSSWKHPAVWKQVSNERSSNLDKIAHHLCEIQEESSTSCVRTDLSKQTSCSPEETTYQFCKSQETLTTSCVKNKSEENKHLLVAAHGNSRSPIKKRVGEWWIRLMGGGRTEPPTMEEICFAKMEIEPLVGFVRETNKVSHKPPILHKN